MTLQVPQISDVKTLSPAPQKRIINVYRDGRVALDRQFVTLEELVSRLKAARGEYEQLGVVVRGDADGAFRNVASALGACRQAGISNMGISVRLASKDR
jgi:biopolymer transport protein ExbD